MTSHSRSARVVTTIKHKADTASMTGMPRPEHRTTRARGRRAKHGHTRPADIDGPVRIFILGERWGANHRHDPRDEKYQVTSGERHVGLRERSRVDRHGSDTRNATSNRGFDALPIRFFRSET
ncbi:hypothetical protein KIP29_gp07 [Mycobacterium phage BabyRay]|uniref:Uncharacterized protein n=1 Tax=Mycobacterium phage BabyRay TaxID=1897486 RepID=A0A1D8EWA0_9CAUD|nr:hypothetical protein KIP29_gp07 [Mycobacterium phage BabyRay]AOT25505.1 hypothetical protein SEA_BABYRAY_93 [Mycobacterium phage BabyRay]